MQHRDPLFCVSGTDPYGSAYVLGELTALFQLGRFQGALDESRREIVLSGSGFGNLVVAAFEVWSVTGEGNPLLWREMVYRPLLHVLLSDYQPNRLGAMLRAVAGCLSPCASDVSSPGERTLVAELLEMSADAGRVQPGGPQTHQQPRIRLSMSGSCIDSLQLPIVWTTERPRAGTTPPHETGSRRTLLECCTSTAMVAGTDEAGDRVYGAATLHDHAGLYMSGHELGYRRDVVVLDGATGSPLRAVALVMRPKDMTDGTQHDRMIGDHGRVYASANEVAGFDDGRYHTLLHPGDPHLVYRAVNEGFARGWRRFSIDFADLPEIPPAPDAGNRYRRICRQLDYEYSESGQSQQDGSFTRSETSRGPVRICSDGHFDQLVARRYFASALQRSGVVAESEPEQDDRLLPGPAPGTTGVGLDGSR